MRGCAAARRLLHESADRELDRDERAALDAHLAACPACRELAEDLPGLLAGLAALPRPGMPPGLRAEIRARTLEAPRRGARRLALLAAAAVLALTLGLWASLHPPGIPAGGSSPAALAAARQVRLALAITGRGIAAAGERGLALSVGNAVAPALARGSRAGLAAALAPPLDLARGLVHPGSALPHQPQEVNP